MTERKSNIRLTKDTPYLALRGEPWGAFYDDFEFLRIALTLFFLSYLSNRLQTVVKNNYESDCKVVRYCV